MRVVNDQNVDLSSIALDSGDPNVDSVVKSLWESAIDDFLNGRISRFTVTDLKALLSLCYASIERDMPMFSKHHISKSGEVNSQSPQ